MHKHFIIIGAPKCGTSTMHNVLDEHPNIAMANGKEINYFINHNKDDLDYDSYLEHFTITESTGYLGEASPRYASGLREYEVFEKMGGFLPTNTRYIYMIRDPLDRMISMYFHMLRKGTKVASFSEIVEKDDRLLRGSNYMGYLKRMKNQHGIEPKIIEFSMFTKQPRFYAKQLVEDLGLDRNGISEGGKDHYNVGEKAVPKRESIKVKNLMFKLVKIAPQGLKDLASKKLKTKVKSVIAGRDAIRIDSPEFKNEVRNVWSLHKEEFLYNKQEISEQYGINTKHWLNKYE